MELVKEILSQLRDGSYHVEEEIEGHSEEKIVYHLKIMEENVLVDVELKEVASKESGRKKEWVIGRMGGLTWKGHEFIDSVTWVCASDEVTRADIICIPKSRC